MATKILGKEDVLRRLNKAIGEIKGRTKAGLWQAGLTIQREAQLRTPVDTGNLKASAYTTAFDTPNGPVAEIGYTASYAVFVHEDLEANHTVGENKFLEHALEEKESEVIEIIAETAKI